MCGRGVPSVEERFLYISLSHLSTKESTYVPRWPDHWGHKGYAMYFRGPKMVALLTVSFPGTKCMGLGLRGGDHGDGGGGQTHFQSVSVWGLPEH